MESIRSVKELAAKHIPKIHDLLVEEHNTWKKLQIKFQSKIGNSASGVVTESSIPILIGKAELGEIISRDFLKYIDETIYSLSLKIPTHLNSKFINMVKVFIQEFDVKTLDNPNPAYLNWLAEFLAIDKFIENSTYELINFETELSNGKNIDYELTDSQGKKYLIDVVNIHIPISKANTKDLLSLTVNCKLDNKISDKTNNLQSGEIIFILPVFWFDDKIKDNILEYLKDANLEQRRIISPVTLVQNLDKKFSFGTIESLFEKY